MELTKFFLPFASGFGLTFAFMPLFIHYFQMKKYGQEIRDEGPKWHNVKAGTPTMGGLVFSLAAIVTSIWAAVWLKLLTPTLFILLFVFLLYGTLGFLDDFIKIFMKRNLGLKSLQKLIGQIIGGVVFYLVFLADKQPNTLNFFTIEIPLSYLYGLFIVFWLVGFSNAVNLTDGIDGLASISLVCISVVGGLVGFFPYNHKPAKIFMGDVGSLALGGLLASISILLHQEWTLLLVGLIYVIETASVMLQVTSFKLTGKRIFKMAPIHHHFEMSGWSISYSG